MPEGLTVADFLTNNYGHKVEAYRTETALQNDPELETRIQTQTTSDSPDDISEKPVPTAHQTSISNPFSEDGFNRIAEQAKIVNSEVSFSEPNTLQSDVPESIYQERPSIPVSGSTVPSQHDPSKNDPLADMSNKELLANIKTMFIAETNRSHDQFSAKLDAETYKIKEDNRLTIAEIKTENAKILKQYHDTTKEELKSFFESRAKDVELRQDELEKKFANATSDCDRKIEEEVQKQLKARLDEKEKSWNKKLESLKAQMYTGCII